MIRLSKLADYAFILLTQMAMDAPKAAAASDLSASTQLPLPTVAKIMKMLAKGGVVTAQRGATGGYRLAASVTDTSIASIIEAVDGPIALTDCVRGSGDQGCAASGVCPMRQGWTKVNQAIKTGLEGVTLADLMEC